MNQTLILNIVPFKPTVQQLSFAFYKEYKEYKEGYAPFYIDEDMPGLLDGVLSKLEQADLQWLYTDFKEPQQGAKTGQ